MKIIITLVGAIALCLAQAAGAETPVAVAGLFGNPANLQTVRHSDRVDVCILRHIAPAVRTDGSVDRSTERYEETMFVPVPASTAAALRDLVVNDKTYDWGAGTGGRRPQFYLRLRFHRGAEVIAVDFCFMCHVLNVSRNGTDLGHANFGRNSDLFLRAFLQVFPHDVALRHVAQEAGLPLD
jgi:hypothetical protein